MIQIKQINKLDEKKDDKEKMKDKKKINENKTKQMRRNLKIKQNR